MIIAISAKTHLPTEKQCKLIMRYLLPFSGYSPPTILTCRPGH